MYIQAARPTAENLSVCEIVELSAMLSAEGGTRMYSLPCRGNIGTGHRKIYTIL